MSDPESPSPSSGGVPAPAATGGWSPLDAHAADGEEPSDDAPDGRSEGAGAPVATPGSDQADAAPAAPAAGAEPEGRADAGGGDPAGNDAGDAAHDPELGPDPAPDLGPGLGPASASASASAPDPLADLPAPLAAALAARGYAQLTPVQAAVAAADARGRDLLVSARTGSGKTVAFGLALGEALLDDAGVLARAPGAPAALVIAPTRELALQVAGELGWLFARTGAVIGTCVGGMDAGAERRRLGAGVTIVVGTPGRLRDHLERGALDLSQLGIAVLDEADEMLDMGFREDLEELLDASGAGRRTLLFSATMPRPIAQLAKRYQRDALTIATEDGARGHGDIDYRCVTVAPADIEHAVVNILRLHDAPTAMLFCATRDNVRHLHASLTERGFAAVALSGEMGQAERNRALQALRDRRARVCVATDVAARGIDLPSLSLVIHVEVPRDPETLQHRSGRTGRAGRQGTAVLVVPYPRRRRVESLLRAAGVRAAWGPAPDPAAIRAADRERLLTTLREAQAPSDADLALGAELLASRSAEELAGLLVAAHRAHLPEPEELIEAPAPRGNERGERHEGAGPPRDLRANFEDSVWFAMDIGRRQRADPKWLLPLLCRRGHVTRGDIGAIRITADETLVELTKEAAPRFQAAVRRTARDDGGEGAVRFLRVAGKPRDAARAARKGPGGDQRGAPRRPQAR